MFLVCVVLLCVGKFSSGSLQGEEVSKWANAIGGQLWSLGKEVTKADEISENYNYLNAKVTEKHPKVLLDDIKSNILRMMDRKMDAITCIQQKAEGISENYVWNGTHSRYRSSTYSFYGVRDDSASNNTGTFWKLNYPDVLNYTDNLYRRYKPMILTPDTHFYNIPVNTSHSSVHVPTNVYDREGNVSEVIEWSEALDEVFAQNYKSDPALSWQYFGSSTGIMRHYPAMHWSSKRQEIRTLFDCRIRTWYIEAATCTKDVIILLDNSGSMDAMGKHIASLTASSILDTFSNNDYVNILNYSDTTSYLIPCFAEQLVQATEENIVIFKEAIKTLKPDGKTSVKKALEAAFDVLKKYREKRQCDDVTKPNCNQAIMILTDGLSANYSDLMTTYNRIEAERAGLNETYIPVRIFTYLIGGETTNVEEIKWLACHNRGYHSAVPNLERVTASVMEYINVVARPLVLQGAEHPISWTHAYADVTYDDEKDTTINEPARLLTSAAIPLFDKKINKQNDTVTALLLGVAATDVPIDEFRKLTTPYKIGVNGYAFIVSNNGYVLMHPDLRPTFKNMLKENYNSIDFTEVEQIDEDFPARNITMNETIKKLRNALVQGEEGNMSNIRLKYHYDDWKRVAEETYDYFFVALEDKALNITTPFSLGIAIPSSYGKFEITPSMNQIKKYQFSGEDLSNYFKGNNWRIHPRWVYCKYHYLEGHEYVSQEEELLHFLGNIYNDNFKWHGQYEKEENETMGKVECGRKTLGDDDYYCDQDLMERLIFDATNTYTSFGEPYAFQTKVEEDLFNDFEVSLRFVGTMSGLTRWDDFSENPKIKNKHGVSNTKPIKDIKSSNNIPPINIDDTEPPNDTEPTNEVPTNKNNIPANNKTPIDNSKTESDTQRKTAPSKKFGDIPLRAIDEKWYKSAVLQRNFDIDSFVYSVPFTYDDLNEVVITGSFAIFVKEGGKEAPGCVVGYQFSQQKFAKKVEEITDKLSVYQRYNARKEKKQVADRFIPNRNFLNAARWNLSHDKTEQQITPPTSFLKTGKFLNSVKYADMAKNYMSLLWSTTSYPQSNKVLNFTTSKNGLERSKQKLKGFSKSDSSWPVYSRSEPLLTEPSTVLDMPEIGLNVYEKFIDWGSKGQIATIFQGEVHLWLASQTTSGHTSTSRTINDCVKWNKEGTLFAAGRETGGVSIIDGTTLKVVQTMMCICLSCTISAIEWTKDGTLLFGCDTGYTSVFSKKLNKSRQKNEQSFACRKLLMNNQITDIQFSCNETYLAITYFGGNFFLHHWDKEMTLWGSFQLFKLPSFLSKSIAFHPWKESLFALGNSKSITIYTINGPNFKTKKISKMMLPSNFYLDFLTFNPLSGELVTSLYSEIPTNDYGVAYLTVISDTCEVVDQVQWVSGRVTYALWDGTGTKLATVSADENLSIWNFFGNNKIFEKRLLNRRKKAPTLDFFETVKLFNCCIR